MLKIYVKTGCPYCALVLKKLHNESIPFTELNIEEGENGTAILERGGKSQVPFLIDEASGFSIYESATIIDYLDSTYVKKAKGKTILAPLQADIKTCTVF
jgi:glutaredoxin